MKTPTLHIAANLGDVAKTVLMPGDPKRARFIAETYFENAVLFNDVRGVQGYTGYYKGKRVSVMASGMGMASIGIYSHELFHAFEVESIIRVGTCGSFHKDLHVRDIAIAQAACTNSNYPASFCMPGQFAPIADFSLLRKAVENCEDKGLRYRVGNMFSSDVFYNQPGKDMEWAKMGVLGVEMEAAALYCNAAASGKKALCICSVTDHFVNEGEVLTPDERQLSLTQMIEVALDIAEE